MGRGAQGESLTLAGLYATAVSEAASVPRAQAKTLAVQQGLSFLKSPFLGAGERSTMLALTGLRGQGSWEGFLSFMD